MNLKPRELAILVTVPVIGFCCTLGALATYSSSRSGSSPVGALATYEPVTLPTDQPTATVTPTEPTATSIPTRTPKDSPQSDDVAFQQYFQEAFLYSLTMANALKGIATLSEVPQPDNPKWIAEIGVNLGTVQGAHEQLVRLNPPVSAQEFHHALVDATGDCNRAADFMANGLAKSSPVDILQASDLIRSCTEKMEASLDKLPADAPVPTPPPAAPVAPTVTFTPVPVATPVPLAPVATSTPYQIPTLPPAPTSPPVSCNCSSDTYNCDDPEARTCFEQCKSQGAGDVHDLDRDNDDRACE